MKALVINGEVVNHLKAYRLDNQLSQEYMGMKLGISRSHYNQLEKGNRSVSDQVAWDIYKTFGRPLDELLEPIYITNSEDLKMGRKKDQSRGKLERS